MSEIKNKVLTICKNSKTASNSISSASTKVKNNILTEAANLIKKNIDKIIAANQIDVENAKNNNLETAKIDRLVLDEKKILSLADTINEIISLEDPTNKILFEKNRPSNINVKRISTPFGVLLAIFESRPNVASDIAALCIKSGNAVILRSGSESINSAKIIVSFFKQALEQNNIDKNAVFLVQETAREYVNQLLKMEKYIDVVIPRGGKSLIKAVLKHTKIAVFRHLDGNCHSYFHQDCDFDKARKILINAKTRRVSICGATESLLIDEKIADKILPLIVEDLTKKNCEIRGDAKAKKICSQIKKATDKDFYTEFLDNIISVKIVKNIDEAIAHINKYSSSHTESIITESQAAADYFFAKIDSAIVMHNASTQFADGAELGLGAEVGIATSKLHARGPVSLEQLVTYKYRVSSDFAIRS